MLFQIHQLSLLEELGKVINNRIVVVAVVAVVVAAFQSHQVSKQPNAQSRISSLFSIIFFLPVVLHMKRKSLEVVSVPRKSSLALQTVRYLLKTDILAALSLTLLIQHTTIATTRHVSGTPHQPCCCRSTFYVT